MSDVTFPITLNRQDGSEILNGDLTAVGGLPGVPVYFAEYTLALTPSSGPYQNVSSLTAQGYMSVDPVGFIGELSTTLTVPATTYAALAQVCHFGPCTISNLPDSTDGFTLAVTIVVADVLATNVATLVGSVDVAAHTATGAITAADLTFTQVTGTDITWDVGSAIVSTTAGGVFGMLAQLTAEYD